MCKKTNLASVRVIGCSTIIQLEVAWSHTNQLVYCQTRCIFESAAKIETRCRLSGSVELAEVSTPANSEPCPSEPMPALTTLLQTAQKFASSTRRLHGRPLPSCAMPIRLTRSLSFQNQTRTRTSVQLPSSDLKFTLHPLAPNTHCSRAAWLSGDFRVLEMCL